MMLDKFPIWQKIFLRGQLRCVYCGLDGGKDAHVFRQLFVCYDHLVPQWAGGGGSEENIVTCCWACNKVKGGFDPRYDGMPSDPAQRRLAMIERVRQHLKRDWDWYQQVLNELQKMAALPQSK
jgi:hypothetical protein